MQGYADTCESLYWGYDNYSSYALTCILSLIQKLGQKICYSNVELELHGDAGYLRSQFEDGSPLTAQRYNLKNAETC